MEKKASAWAAQATAATTYRLPETCHVCHSAPSARHRRAPRDSHAAFWDYFGHAIEDTGLDADTGFGDDANPAPYPTAGD